MCYFVVHGRLKPFRVGYSRRDCNIWNRQRRGICGRNRAAYRDSGHDPIGGRRELGAPQLFPNITSSCKIVSAARNEEGRQITLDEEAPIHETGHQAGGCGG